MSTINAYSLSPSFYLLLVRQNVTEYEQQASQSIPDILKNSTKSERESLVKDIKVRQTGKPIP